MSCVGSQRPVLTTSFGILAAGTSMGLRRPALLTCSKPRRFENNNAAQRTLSRRSEATFSQPDSPHNEGFLVAYAGLQVGAPGHLTTGRYRRQPKDHTWALPPSTNSSVPVTKLESSEARYSTAFAISSGSPIRPIGIVDTIRSMISAGWSVTGAVPTGPGLTTFDRMRRSLSSTVHVRTNDRKAAFVAPYTPWAAVPLEPATEPVRMIDPPSFRRGSAFCTAKRAPLTFVSINFAKCSSVMLPKEARSKMPALAKTMSIRPLFVLMVSYRRSRSLRFVPTA